MSMLSVRAGMARGGVKGEDGRGEGLRSFRPKQVASR